MAKGKKTGGRNFQKGQVTNPLGGAAVRPETRAIRTITAATFKEVADLILDGNVQGLKEIVSDPNSSVIRVWIAKAAATAIQKGDLGPLDQILNRAIGRPKERVEHTGEDGDPIKVETDFKISLQERIAQIKGKK